MSLIAVSSRHLRSNLSFAVNNVAVLSHHRLGAGNIFPAAAGTARRHISSSNVNGMAAKGNPGLRPRSSQKAAAATPAAPMDPHSIANEMVSSAVTSEGRAPGTEAVATLTREQKLSNYAMAAGLLGFVSYIFYYSLASVGGGQNAKALLFGSDDAQNEDGEGETSNPGFEEFLKEANEGRAIEEERLRADRAAIGEARELVEVESSTAARLKAEGVGEDVVVAGSASEEEEVEMARVAGFVEGEEEQGEAGSGNKRRPLWKRVVFFWRRE